MIKFAKTLNGFTLVEILVAIAIIGIVFGVVISSGSALQKRSRDTQRQSDLRQIQSALQQYYADQSYYPLTLNYGGELKSPDGSKTYLTTIPTEPQATPPYCYQPQSSQTITSCDNNTARCYFYNLYAKLENPAGAAMSYSCGGTTTYNLQITPLQ